MPSVNAGSPGTALDVFRQEPLPPDSPLWQLPNLLITPHNGGIRHPNFSGEALNQFLDNLRRYVRGEPLRNQVDKTAGDLSIPRLRVDKAPRWFTAQRLRLVQACPRRHVVPRIDRQVCHQLLARPRGRRPLPLEQRRVVHPERHPHRIRPCPIPLQEQPMDARLRPRYPEEARLHAGRLVHASST